MGKAFSLPNNSSIGTGLKASILAFPADSSSIEGTSNIGTSYFLKILSNLFLLNELTRELPIKFDQSSLISVNCWEIIFLLQIKTFFLIGDFRLKIIL